VISKDFSVGWNENRELESERKALLIAEVVRSKLAEEIAVSRVTELTSLTDYLVICSVETGSQMRAIEEAVDCTLSKEGTHPLGIEGREGGVWLLMDYGDVILHVFKEDVRGFYNLDRLWGDAPQITLSAPVRKNEAGEGKVG